MSNTIKLTVERTGGTEFEIDRAEYEQAKADGTLYMLLDPYLSFDYETTVTEPDGTEFDPYTLEARG